MIIGTMLGDEREVAAALMTLGGDARVRYGGILIGLAEYEKKCGLMGLIWLVIGSFWCFLCSFCVLFDDLS